MVEMGGAAGREGMGREGVREEYQRFLWLKDQPAYIALALAHAPILFRSSLQGVTYEEFGGTKYGQLQCDIVGATPNKGTIRIRWHTPTHERYLEHGPCFVVEQGKREGKKFNVLRTLAQNSEGVVAWIEEAEVRRIEAERYGSADSAIQLGNRTKLQGLHSQFLPNKELFDKILSGLRDPSAFIGSQGSDVSERLKQESADLKAKGCENSTTIVEFTEVLRQIGEMISKNSLAGATAARQNPKRVYQVAYNLLQNMNGDGRTYEITSKFFNPALIRQILAVIARWKPSSGPNGKPTIDPELKLVDRCFSMLALLDHERGAESAKSIIMKRHADKGYWEIAMNWYETFTDRTTRRALCEKIALDREGPYDDKLRVRVLKYLNDKDKEFLSTIIQNIEVSPEESGEVAKEVRRMSGAADREVAPANLDEVVVAGGCEMSTASTQQREYVEQLETAQTLRSVLALLKPKFTKPLEVAERVGDTIYVSRPGIGRRELLRWGVAGAIGLGGGAYWLAKILKEKPRLDGQGPSQQIEPTAPSLPDVPEIIADPSLKERVKLTFDRLGAALKGVPEVADSVLRQLQNELKSESELLKTAQSLAAASANSRGVAEKAMSDRVGIDNEARARGNPNKNLGQVFLDENARVGKACVEHRNEKLRMLATYYNDVFSKRYSSLPAITATDWSEALANWNAIPGKQPEAFTEVQLKAMSKDEVLKVRKAQKDWGKLKEEKEALSEAAEVLIAERKRRLDTVEMARGLLDQIWSLKEQINENNIARENYEHQTAMFNGIR